MTEEFDYWPLVAKGQRGILATNGSNGCPHLSSILYVAGGDRRELRVSTTTRTVKYRNLRRDPRAAVHVELGDFWAWSVMECTVHATDPTRRPDDRVATELFALYSAIYGAPDDPDTFFTEMISAGRVILHLGVERIYGLKSVTGRRPIAPSEDRTAATMSHRPTWKRS